MCSVRPCAFFGYIRSRSSTVTDGRTIRCCLFQSKQNIGRGSYTLTRVHGWRMLPVTRFLSRYLMQKLGIGQINILIAGAGETGKLVCREFAQSCYYGFRVIGYLDDNRAKRGELIEGHPVLGSLAAAGKIARKSVFQAVHS